MVRANSQDRAGSPYSVLYPAIAEAAHRAGSEAIGLIDVGDGSNLDVDRVGITYSNGQSLGDPASPVQLSATLKGAQPVPTRAIPEVVARADADPLAVADAFASVPADALPVVITTWALSKLSLENRLRFLQCLDAGRLVAWVSAEGTGVAPAIPTLGDRRAFGHSIIGLALLDRTGVHAEALGRCWSRGRWLEWLPNR